MQKAILVSIQIQMLRIISAREADVTKSLFPFNGSRRTSFFALFVLIILNLLNEESHESQDAQQDLLLF